LLEPGKDIIVDWPQANPVKERPDIWVNDPQDSDGPLYRVNHFFDVEQLSNAYRDVKQVGWIFTWPEHQSIVAAAAASQLTKRFDLLPGSEAFRRAKVSQASLDQGRYQLSARLPPGPDLDAINNLSVATGKPIRPPPEIFEAQTRLEPQERIAVGARLAPQIAAAGIDRAYYDDLYAALEVLKILLTHCITYNRHNVFRDDISPENEARFQKHLLEFCSNDERCNQLFNIAEGSHLSGGITDVLFHLKGITQRTVVVELKSSPETITSLYDKHGGQPLQYAEASLSRFSVLYCQYADNNAIAVADTMQVRHNTAPESPSATFCLGQKAFWEIPSKLGRSSRK